VERSFSNFDDSLKSDYTRQAYRTALEQFRSYAKARTYDDITKVEPKALQENLIDWIKVMKNDKLAPLSIRLKLAAVKHFCVMNDVILNWPKVMKFVGSSRIMTKDRIYTKAELQRILDKCDERKRVMILMLISTGIRIGALPFIKIKHLAKIDPFGLYRVVIYADDPEEYSVFTTIECAKAIDSYLEYRKRSGEALKPESPLIREQFNQDNAEKPRPITIKTAMGVLTKVIEDAGARGATDNRSRHEIMPFHGFRKFANTMMAQAGVKQVIKEMLLGHQVGLEKNYLRPSEQEMLSEYMKAIDLLTVSEEKQLQVKVEKLQVQNDELIQILKDKISALERANQNKEIVEANKEKLPLQATATKKVRKA
jgi:integrase